MERPVNAEMETGRAVRAAILSPASLRVTGQRHNLSQVRVIVAGAESGLASLHEGVHGACRAVHRVVDLSARIFRLANTLKIASCYNFCAFLTLSSHQNCLSFLLQIVLCASERCRWIELIDGRVAICKGQV